MPFKNINRPKRIPQASIKAGLIAEITGENRLEVRNENGETHLYLTGTVGKSWWDDSGIGEDETREALDSIPKGTKIHVHINSEGGEVKTGLGIYNAFKSRGQDITSHIDGYAVSIASVIPLAASKVISPKSAVWMIHNASCGAYGDDSEMDKASKMLKEHNVMLSEIYAEHTGKKASDCLADMKAETWIRGSQAIEYGLADECDETDCSNNLRALPQAMLDKFMNCPTPIYNMISAPKQENKNKPTEQNNIMNRTQIEALLKQWGVTFNATATDAELAALVQAGKPAATVAPPDNSAIIAQMAKITKARITDKVKAYVDSNQITNDEVSIWVEAALKDEAAEAATFNILDAKAAVNPGGEPAGYDIQMGRANVHQPIVGANLQGRLDDKFYNMCSEKKGDSKAIYNELKENYPVWAAMHGIRPNGQSGFGVRNENTFSGTFTTAFLITRATTAISPKFASVKMFSRDETVDPYKPLASGIMQYNTTAQDGSTTQTNATNFESGDSVLTPVTVTVAQYTESFHVTNGQLNSGLRMENLADAKINSLGSKVAKVLAANITAANFATLSPIIRSPGAFGFSDMQTAWGQLKKANLKHMALDGEYLANLINIPSLFQPTPVIPGAGWKNLLGWDYIALHTEWSAAGANIRGFGCDPQALGVIAGLPLLDAPAIPGGILAQGSGMLPGVDLAVAVYSWFNTSTRTYWASFDLMFGANALDTTAGLVIASGAPS